MTIQQTSNGWLTKTFQHDNELIHIRRQSQYIVIVGIKVNSQTSKPNDSEVETKREWNFVVDKCWIMNHGESQCYKEEARNQFQRYCD